LGHFSGIGPCFPLAGDCANFTPTPEEKTTSTVQRQPLLVQNMQQANQILSMHNYTPLVISRNDKNKPNPSRETVPGGQAYDFLLVWLRSTSEQCPSLVSESSSTEVPLLK
jgi:hypothetical protein